MLTTAHAVTGATIGVLVPNPWLAIPLAVGSHFVLDSIPHWQETLAPYVPNKKTYIRIPVDVALAIVLVSVIVMWHPTFALTIWLYAALANVPDLDTLTILLPKLRRGVVSNFYNWHCDIQRETSSMWGVVTQASLVIICILITFPR